MNNTLNKFDTLTFTLGRALLGTYFLLPGVMKVFQYSGTLQLMLKQGVPFAELLLPVTIALQIGLGLSLIVGKTGARYLASVLVSRRGMCCLPTTCADTFISLLAIARPRRRSLRRAPSPVAGGAGSGAGITGGSAGTLPWALMYAP